MTGASPDIPLVDYLEAKIRPLRLQNCSVTLEFSM